MSVSYTHLDVYKRQVMSSVKIYLICVSVSAAIYLISINLFLIQMIGEKKISNIKTIVFVSVVHSFDNSTTDSKSKIKCHALY